MEISPVTNQAPLLQSDPAAFQAMMKDPEIGKAEKQGVAAREFEAIFLRQFLEDALEPSLKGILGDGGSAGSIYRSQVIDMMAGQLAQSGTFGFASTLQQSLQSEQDTQPHGNQ
jgi:Rod binding domain-containing protein